MNYRVIERRMDDGAWMPFGVAFEQSDGDIFFFSTRWRRGAQLQAPSVSELQMNHLPTSLREDSYRWAPEKSWLRSDDFHPIDIITSELDKRQKQMSLEKKLSLAAQGDKEMLDSAIEEMRDRWGWQIFNYANSKLKNESSAQDVTQTVLAKAYTAARRFNSLEYSSVKAWLFGIAKNVVNTELRKLYRDMKIVPFPPPKRVGEEEEEITWEETIPDESLSPVEIIEKKEIEQITQKALREAPLTEKQREIINCLYYLDLTYEETAKMVGLKRRQDVTYHLNKALNTLHRWLIGKYQELNQIRRED